MLTTEQIKNALIFISRATVEGDESFAYVDVKRALFTELQSKENITRDENGERTDADKQCTDGATEGHDS